MLSVKRRVLVLIGTGMAVAALSTASFGTAFASDGGRTIEISDACDPATFNPQGALCAPHKGGNVQFFTLINTILADPRDVLKERKVLHWEFSEHDISVARGAKITLHNFGGELHTFTNVGQSGFTQGCVGPVNDLFGTLLRPAPTGLCTTAFPFSANINPVPPLSYATFMAPTTPGNYFFQCTVHPWMRINVTVS
jgi:hypothetical protein